MNVLEQGRYYLFEMYVSVDLQRDELENNKILPTVLKHSKKIDTESNQEWLSRTTNVHRQLDDNELINPTDSDSGFGEIIKVENVKPYYPVLPKYNNDGRFRGVDSVEDYPSEKKPFPQNGPITDENESNENLIFSIKNSTSPVLVFDNSDKNSFYVIMPMKI